MINTKIISKQSIEVSIDSYDGYEKRKRMAVILHESSDGQLFITPKKPAKFMLIKNYSEDGKKKSIFGERKYDVIKSNEINIMTSFEKIVGK